LGWVSQFLNVPYIRAVEVVAAIFNMKLPITLNDDELEYVSMVKESIISVGYSELREKLFTRTQTRYNDRRRDIFVQFYDQQQKQIDNIRNNVTDANFVYEKPPQKVYFKINEDK